MMTLNHPATENALSPAPAQPIRVSNKWAARALTLLMFLRVGLLGFRVPQLAGVIRS
jgi:hypothetical protein